MKPRRWTIKRLGEAVRRHEIEATSHLRASVRCLTEGARSSFHARAVSHAVAAGRLHDVLAKLAVEQWRALA